MSWTRFRLNRGFSSADGKCSASFYLTWPILFLASPGDGKLLRFLEPDSVNIPTCQWNYTPWRLQEQASFGGKRTLNTHKSKTNILGKWTQSRFGKASSSRKKGQLISGTCQIWHEWKEGQSPLCERLFTFIRQQKFPVSVAFWESNICQPQSLQKKRHLGSVYEGGTKCKGTCGGCSNDQDKYPRPGSSVALRDVGMKHLHILKRYSRHMTFFS